MHTLINIRTTTHYDVQIPGLTTRMSASRTCISKDSKNLSPEDQKNHESGFEEPESRRPEESRIRTDDAIKRLLEFESAASTEVQ